MSCAPSSRPAALWGSTRSRSGTSTCDSSQSISATRFAVMRTLPVVGVAVDDACLTSDEPRPRCSASSNALRRHRAEVDLRPGLGVQEVGRRSPTWALRPALRQPMQPAERVGHATPVGLRLGRSALHVCHHHQTVHEQPAVRRRDRHRHGQTFTVEVLEELGLPREISVAPGTETTDREVPVDAHAPHVVGDSASEWFDASYVFTPLPECLPSHWRHFRGVPEIARANRTSRIGATRITAIVTRQDLGRHCTANARRRDHRIVGGTGNCCVAMTDGFGTPQKFSVVQRFRELSEVLETRTAEPIPFVPLSRPERPAPIAAQPEAPVGDQISWSRPGLPAPRRFASPSKLGGRSASTFRTPPSRARQIRGKEREIRRALTILS